MRRRPAVTGASLTIPPGGFLALVGPNGSGKSTLLKTLFRALKPERGRLVLGEKDLWEIPHRENARAVGVLAAGRVVAAGPPLEVLTRETLIAHFRVDGTVSTDPVTGQPRVLLRA